METRLPHSLILAALLCSSATATASPRGEALCADPRSEHAAGAALGQWAENFPFAKVIIGNEGRDGVVFGPEVAVETSDFVVCRGTYSLVEAGPYGRGYTVGIPAFFYRITPSADGYRVTVEDFPTTLEGSAITSRELLSRFTIDGRPYLEILEANQRRLQQQGRRTGQ